MGFLWNGAEGPQGFLLGKVVNNYDKDHVGMVQVSVHALKEKFNTLEWMRVLSPAAGAKKGFFFLPDVGDEVLVSFVDNDPDNPLVLGCLWNADSYPEGAVTEKNTLKKIITQSGLCLTLDEEKDKERIELTTPKGLKITLADETETITVSDKDGNNTLTVDSKNKTITVKSADKLDFEGKNVTIKGSDSLKIEGKALTLEASDKVVLKGNSKLEASGGQVEIKGSSKLALSGAQAELKASATLKLEGSAMTEVKGGMVKING